jgi:hypothetical protein
VTKPTAGAADCRCGSPIKRGPLGLWHHTDRPPTGSAYCNPGDPFPFGPLPGPFARVATPTQPPTTTERRT